LNLLNDKRNFQISNITNPDYLVENLNICKLSSPIQSPQQSIKTPESEEHISEIKETLFIDRFRVGSPNNTNNVYSFNSETRIW
jgi:hypothetical protein